jgi:tetratricopeptide (TPR) repeat protein
VIALEGGAGPLLQAGGTLVPGRHVYIARPEDAVLLRLLRAGEYVNVLSARQMGKSSLMVRTMQALQQDGVRTTAVDLAAELSGAVGTEAWFRGLLGRLCRDLDLDLNIGAFWAAHPDDTPGQKLQRFFRDVAAPAAASPLIVFLDEIESTLKFDFADSLFTALRGMYNERGLVPSYARTSFSLLGVATPNELIKDRRTTPYNIGTTLELRSFDLRRDDLSMLAHALAEDAAFGQSLLARVLYWTGGQPFLTLKLCADLRDVAADSPAAVDALVHESFANLERVGRDVHFVQIVRFLQERLSSPLEVLDLYRRVLAGERIREQPSLAHLELKLSGLVMRDSKGFLTLHNRIYARLFDEQWLMTARQKFERTGRLLDDLLAAISAEQGVPLAVLRQILEGFGEAGVGLDALQIQERLRGMAERYHELRDHLDHLNNEDPRVGSLRREAAALIDAGRFDTAEAKLADAEAIDLATIEDMSALVDRHRASAAAIRAERASAARLRLNYTQAASHFAAAASIVAQDQVSAWHYRLRQAGALFDQGAEFGDNAALREAIAIYYEALRLAPRERGPLDWAAAQNDLGNTLQVLGERESGTARLEEAVAAYRAALQERTRDRVPLDWAQTQNNLGTALRTLGERESGTLRLEEAVAAYRAALEEYKRERVPLDWATVQNNLGNALQALGERESGTARLEEAVAAYHAALQERTRDRVPLDWAQTQTNLGTALVRLGERESGTARLEEAVAAFSAALLEWRHERVPLQWAATQTNYGTALLRLGERGSGTARLEAATAAYRAALVEWTRERVPLQWAATQTNLGTALLRLGERESETARVEEAVAAYRAALQVRTREQVPLDWAQTQNNLGAALRTLGERESGTLRLQEAVAAYRAALEEYQRERVPLQWAATQTNLGNALTGLGARESGTARLEEAVAAFRAALEEYTRERVPLDWATVQNNLGSALQALGERESGTVRLEEAVAAYNTALQERTRDRVPLDWAQTQTNLGTALMRLGERESGTTRLEEAVTAFRAAIELAGLGEHHPLLDAARLGLALAEQNLTGRLEGRQKTLQPNLVRRHSAYSARRR